MTFTDRSGRIQTPLLRAEEVHRYLPMLTVIFEHNPGAEWRLIPKGEK